MNLNWQPSDGGERASLKWEFDEHVGGEFAEANGFQYQSNPIGLIVTAPEHGVIFTQVTTYPKQLAEDHANAVERAVAEEVKGLRELLEPANRVVDGEEAWLDSTGKETLCRATGAPCPFCGKPLWEASNHRIFCPSCSCDLPKADEHLVSLLRKAGQCLPGTVGAYKLREEIDTALKEKS